MAFKKRTAVIFAAFMVLAMISGSVLTLAIVGPLSFASNKSQSLNAVTDTNSAASTASNGKEEQKIIQAMNLIESRYVNKVDSTQLADGAISGMLAALDDPFSAYMDAKEASQFNETLSSTFQGIGAEVIMQQGKVTILSPIKGSPAEKAGLQPNDAILSVNGDSLEGLSLNDAVMKIRGPKGTQAKLQIQRPGITQPMQIIVVRSEIKYDTIDATMLPDHIGKIEIRQFSFDTDKRFNEELTKLEQQGMKGLIIDVRNDPGGLLTAVTAIAENFVPDGKPIVILQDRNGTKDPQNSKGQGKSYPVDVLINGGSASASEILAGALHDNIGAKLIGEKSFGKGTVQVTFDKEFNDGSDLKLTIAKWLTPNGVWIHKKGIEPDIKVDQPAYFKVLGLSKKQTLKYDMTGDDVKMLQIMLQGLGIEPGRTDGYFSKDTEAAVKQFQTSHQLAVNGEVDSKTAEWIEEAIFKKIRDPKNDAQLNAAVQDMQSKISK